MHAFAMPDWVHDQFTEPLIVNKILLLIYNSVNSGHKII